MLTKDDFLDIIHANTDSVFINGKMEIVSGVHSIQNIFQHLKD